MLNALEDLLASFVQVLTLLLGFQLGLYGPLVLAGLMSVETLAFLLGLSALSFTGLFAVVALFIVVPGLLLLHLHGVRVG